MLRTKADITMAELELSATCNLKCPLCVRSNPDFKDFVKPNIRPLSEIIAQLEEYPNLENMCIAGIMTEPTHYPELIPLIQYLESRKIKTEVYINGTTKTEEWWEMFGREVSKETRVIFTVCGSTQELHEKYRVGSDLETVYRNADAFRKNGKCNDFIQIIKFNYNEEDVTVNRDKIIRNFNNVIEINSLPYQERFGMNSDIKMVEKLSIIYERLKTATLKRMDDSQITCKSIQTNFVSIDQTGKIYPCFLYKLYGPKEDFNLDYTDILEAKHDFCFECERMAATLIEATGLERMA